MSQLYSSQISAQTGASTSAITSRVSPEAFGAGVGRATEFLGAQIGAAGELAFRIDKTRIDEEIANKVAMFDASDKILDLKNEMGPGAEGYQDRARTLYLDTVEDHVKDIKRDKVRDGVRRQLESQLPAVQSRASVYEHVVEAEHSTNLTNDSLNTLQNRILSNPGNYAQDVKVGEDVIDAKAGITSTLKEGMKATWRGDSARSYFDGRMEAVNTKEDIDDLSEELVGIIKGPKNWEEELRPADFSVVMNKIGTLRKSHSKAADSTAKTLLGDVEERSQQNAELVASEQLEQAQRAVLQSSNRDTHRRMARVMRDQEIIKINMRLNEADLQRQINMADGNPGLAYPNLPPVVSDAVNKASDKFGVSASYLGAMATKEYGSYFSKPKVKAADKFKPKALDGALDMTGLTHDVINAATMAGQAIDQPLNIVQAPAGAPDGISVSILGMGTQSKVKLVQALVDAGFTGFEEREGSLHVSMKPQVPSDFGGKDGAFWGGATFLSPEVSEVLLSRGFLAGVDARGIKRKDIPPSENDIDFGRPTGVTDKEGKPVTTALGLTQFTKSTWLETVKDPNVAAIMGLDPETMTDKELLEFRKDPTLSMMAAAAYAQSNSKKIANAIGRTPDDAELYMAHFLGPAGAVGLIDANANSPDQIAAKLFPDAAKSNRNVFYEGNKAKTIQQVYDGVSDGFVLTPTQVAYDDNKVNKKLLENMRTGLKKDPISHAEKVGVFSITPLFDEEGFNARGAQAAAVADYYTIPLTDMKPFTVEEASLIQKNVSGGTADEQLAMMAELNNMGADMSRAALNQIEAYDPVFAHAADLQAGGGAPAAATIIRGRKRLQDNPNLKQQIGVDDIGFAEAFTKATGGALFGVEPAQRQAIQDAALAHYVESNPLEQFSAGGAFTASVHAVLGGDRGPVIGDVNGLATLLPVGLDEETVERALDNMTLADWSIMSEEGGPPLMADGAVLNPGDVKGEVMLRALGNNQYVVMLDDGGKLTTGQLSASGNPQAFVFVPDVKRLEQIAYKPQQGFLESVFGGR